MKRIGFITAVLAFIIVALLVPFEVVGIPLAPVAAMIIGAAAGWWASTTFGSTPERGASAGAIAGIGALLGSMIGLAVLALIVGTMPEMQEMVRNSEPHPEARIPMEWIGPMALVGGALGGFLLGLIDLVLSTVAGLFAALLYGRNRRASTPVAR
ncbi:MAG TPA: hypothetical protein VFT66_04585 [Roseiflexaceae bacterium]|jgi:hypothetical protein|nr:hypothetical protein [Roseiflexaceae bacterium]